MPCSFEIYESNRLIKLSMQLILMVTWDSRRRDRRDDHVPGG
jgi:hypothetical protein